MEKLQAFVSGNAQKIYKIKPKNKKVVLEKTAFTVPSDYRGVVPMYADETLSYCIKEAKNG